MLQFHLLEFLVSFRLVVFVSCFQSRGMMVMMTAKLICFVFIITISALALILPAKCLPYIVYLSYTLVNQTVEMWFLQIYFFVIYM